MSGDELPQRGRLALLKEMLGAQLVQGLKACDATRLLSLDRELECRIVGSPNDLNGVGTPRTARS
jgi:hypothetical protein